MLSANIIGCGKLGKTIGKLLAQYDALSLQGVVNSSIDSARNSVAYLGKGIPCENLHSLPKSDIYFITTKDDLIEESACKLQNSNILCKGNIILHCSGSLTSDVLNKTKESKCFVASVHPIKSFAQPDQAVTTFNGTYCAIEGDQEAITVLTQIFQKIGGIVFPIKKENKKIYHAGGVIANNYLVTLHYHATQCYINAGVDKEIAQKIVSMLMKDAFDNLSRLPHHQALTGPIQRGDVNTIIKHTSSLDQVSSLKETKDIYLSMGRGTLSFIDHELPINKKLHDVLAEESFFENINITNAKL